MENRARSTISLIKTIKKKVGRLIIVKKTSSKYLRCTTEKVSFRYRDILLISLLYHCLVMIKVGAVQSNPKAWVPPLVLLNKESQKNLHDFNNNNNNGAEHIVRDAPVL